MSFIRGTEYALSLIHISAELAEKMDMPEDKIRKILKIAKEPISMETPIGDDEDSHLGAFLEDFGTVAPAEAAQQSSLTAVSYTHLDVYKRQIHYLVEQRNNAANVVAAGKFRHHTAVQTMHFDLRMKRICNKTTAAPNDGWSM